MQKYIYALALSLLAIAPMAILRPTTAAYIMPAEAYAFPAAPGGDKIYRKPRYRDERLDWCLNWARDCGKPAADMFCQSRRFTGASDFRQEANIGRTEPTRLIGTDQVCNGPNCAGFDYITCYGQLPVDQVFGNPVWKGNRLDWCLNWSRDCGKPAADAFCKANGYPEAIYFRGDTATGTHTTRLIGTDQLCTQKFCRAFNIITCRGT